MNFTTNQFQMQTRGEGFNKSENFADFINGSSLAELGVGQRHLRPEVARHVQHGRARVRRLLERSLKSE